ncbi:hypothetical protein KIPB_009291, partial [Kipferlia bialata]
GIRAECIPIRVSPDSRYAAVAYPPRPGATRSEIEVTLHVPYGTPKSPSFTGVTGAPGRVTLHKPSSNRVLALIWSCPDTLVAVTAMGMETVTVKGTGLQMPSLSTHRPVSLSHSATFLRAVAMPPKRERERGIDRLDRDRLVVLFCPMAKKGLEAVGVSVRGKVVERVFRAPFPLLDPSAVSLHVLYGVPVLVVQAGDRLSVYKVSSRLSAPDPTVTLRLGSADPHVIVSYQDLLVAVTPYNSAHVFDLRQGREPVLRDIAVGCSLDSQSGGEVEAERERERDEGRWGASGVGSPSMVSGIDSTLDSPSPAALSPGPSSPPTSSSTPSSPPVNVQSMSWFHISNQYYTASPVVPVGRGRGGSGVQHVVGTISVSLSVITQRLYPLLGQSLACLNFLEHRGEVERDRLTAELTSRLLQLEGDRERPQAKEREGERETIARYRDMHWLGVSRHLVGRLAKGMERGEGEKRDSTHERERMGVYHTPQRTSASPSPFSPLPSPFRVSSVPSPMLPSPSLSHANSPMATPMSHGHGNAHAHTPQGRAQAVAAVSPSLQPGVTPAPFLLGGQRAQPQGRRERREREKEKELRSEPVFAALDGNTLSHTVLALRGSVTASTYRAVVARLLASYLSAGIQPECGMTGAVPGGDIGLVYQALWDSTETETEAQGAPGNASQSRQGNTPIAPSINQILAANASFTV